MGVRNVKDLSLVVATLDKAIAGAGEYTQRRRGQGASQAAADGSSLGKIGLLAYAVSVGQRRPQLRRSQLISLLDLVYFVLVCGAWIAYADARGI
ncbi:MAG TPA: hypothetical protein VGE88_01660 [Lysobacter sp.]